MRLTNRQIIDALRQVNGMVYLAARRLGCSPTTIYNRMAKAEGIRHVCETARGELIDVAEQKLKSAVEKGEPWAISLVLRTIGKSRGYVERQEVLNSVEIVWDWKSPLERS